MNLQVEDTFNSLKTGTTVDKLNGIRELKKRKQKTAKKDNPRENKRVK